MGYCASIGFMSTAKSPLNKALEGIRKLNDQSAPLPMHRDMSQRWDNLAGKPTDTREGSGRKNRPNKAIQYAARILLAGASLTGAGILVHDLPNTNPDSTIGIQEYVATATQTPNTAKGDVYKISIGENGTIYGGLSAIAMAEGKNPTSTPVTEALTQESNQIQGLIEAGVVSPQSNGVVSPQVTSFDVVADSKIVNNRALESAAPEEIISKIS